ncbi:hypothetical protein HG15A2_32300 [Adhaeretor mobilis]|uniref:Uncharacterized protein n=1 Tax=Adhaeretor mobilis TaxID=1930276 RepID=A0A517MYF5_9BACT|nr:hypothetical protein HG15A2_32300 [Adhaeretor mobilis]
MSPRARGRCGNPVEQGITDHDLCESNLNIESKVVKIQELPHSFRKDLAVIQSIRGQKATTICGAHESVVNEDQNS